MYKITVERMSCIDDSVDDDSYKCSFNNLKGS